MARHLVLASGSRYRARLLERLDLPFEQIVPGVDERDHDHLLSSGGAEALALHLARLKAHAVAVLRPGALILAADQVGVLDTPHGALQLLKPGTAERAVAQLVAMSGSTHELVNGIVLLDSATGGERALVDRHRITMRHFTREEAAAYVAAFEPFDTAGGYRIEDSADLIERIDSPDSTGIEGLPLRAVARLLAEAGQPAAAPDA